MTHLLIRKEDCIQLLKDFINLGNKECYTFLPLIIVALAAAASGLIADLII
jgi:hypothetical protein